MSLVYPCKVTKGEHDWRRGLDRHWSCSRCNGCLNVEFFIHEERRLRRAVKRLREAKPR